MKSLTSNIQNHTMSQADLLAFEAMTLPPSNCANMNINEFRYAMAAELKENPLPMDDIIEVLGTSSVEFYVGDIFTALKIEFANQAAFDLARQRHPDEEVEVCFALDFEKLSMWIKLHTVDVQFVETIRNVTIEHLQARLYEPEIKALFEATV